MFICVDASRPSQQFFSHVGMEPSLLVYEQYFFGECMRLQPHCLFANALKKFYIILQKENNGLNNHTNVVVT